MKIHAIRDFHDTSGALFETLFVRPSGQILAIVNMDAQDDAVMSGTPPRDRRHIGSVMKSTDVPCRLMARYSAYSTTISWG